MHLIRYTLPAGFKFQSLKRAQQMARIRHFSLSLPRLKAPLTRTLHRLKAIPHPCAVIPRPA